MDDSESSRRRPAVHALGTIAGVTLTLRKLSREETARAFARPGADRRVGIRRCSTYTPRRRQRRNCTRRTLQPCRQAPARPGANAGWLSTNVGISQG
jgi:hypothetical protein